MNANAQNSSCSERIDKFSELKSWKAISSCIEDWPWALITNSLRFRISFKCLAPKNIEILFLANLPLKSFIKWYQSDTGIGLSYELTATTISSKSSVWSFSKN